MTVNKTNGESLGCGRVADSISEYVQTICVHKLLTMKYSTDFPPQINKNIMTVLYFRDNIISDFHLIQMAKLSADTAKNMPRLFQVGKKAKQISV